MKNLNISYRLISVLVLSGIIYLGFVVYLYFASNKQEKLILTDSRMRFTNEVHSLITLKTTSLKQVTNDYTYWNDFVETLEKYDSVWYENNITSILKSFHVDYVCVYDAKFNLLHQAAVDGFISRNFIPAEVLVSLQEKRFLEYFQVIPDGLIEISCASVHPESDPSHMLTQPRGYLFLVRCWNQKVLKETASLTGAQVSMVLPEDSVNPDGPYTISVLENLNDWNGQITARLTFTRESDSLRIFHQMSFNLILLLVCAILFMAVIFHQAIRNWVSKPLKLVTNLLKAGNQEEIEELQKCPGEFKDIGMLFHDFISQKTELKHAKEKAEYSDRLKTAFLANMSHEIRTPMNGILGFTDLLKEPDLTDEERDRFIGIIQKSGTRLLNIINDLIEISKIEAGQMEITNHETNLNEQIEFICSFFKPEVEKKGMQIFQKIPLAVESATVLTDREKLYAILTNLVKNAIKYSLEGFIVVGYEKKNKYWEFFVKDTGIGIPRDRQLAIFDRFVQADVADKSALQGAGLGLSIAQAYVRMLGGEIWVESDPGKGSTFYFTIPA